MPAVGQTQVRNGYLYTWLGNIIGWHKGGKVSSTSGSGGKSGGSGSGSGGSGKSGGSGGGVKSGGSGGTAKAKTLDTWHSIMNDIGISSNMTVAQRTKAASVGKTLNLDASGFETYLQKNYAKAYALSTPGRQLSGNFRQVWTSLYGGVPKLSDYVNYLKTGQQDTNSMQTYLETTSTGKKLFADRGFNQAAPDVQADPSKFMSYYNNFRDTMAQYGATFNNSQAQTAFGQHLDPTALGNNAQTVFGGQESYDRFYGTPMQHSDVNSALFTNQGNALRAKLAGAYNIAQGFDQSKQASFNTGLNNNGKVQEAGTF